MEEGREKGSGDGFIMDPCLVSLVAADYHGYKLVKHDLLGPHTHRCSQKRSQNGNSQFDSLSSASQLCETVSSVSLRIFKYSWGGLRVSF